MLKNCVTGNPSLLNPCEYGWERNEGEKSLKPTILPAGIKIASAEILETTRCKCASTQCKTNKCSCVRAGLTVQNSVIVSNAIIKVTCTWMIMKLRMKIMKAKMAQKMNNLVDMR